MASDELRSDGRGGVLRFVIYALIGGVGTLAHYAILFALVWGGLAHPTLATTLGALVGAAVNYVLNARLNFRTKVEAVGAARFGAVALVGIAINALVVHLLAILAGAPIVAAQVAATLVVLGTTFFLNSLWTFRRPGVDANARSGRREREGRRS